MLCCTSSGVKSHPPEQKQFIIIKYMHDFILQTFYRLKRKIQALWTLQLHWYFEMGHQQLTEGQLWCVHSSAGANDPHSCADHQCYPRPTAWLHVPWHKRPTGFLPRVKLISTKPCHCRQHRSCGVYVCFLLSLLSSHCYSGADPLPVENSCKLKSIECFQT